MFYLFGFALVNCRIFIYLVHIRLLSKPNESRKGCQILTGDQTRDNFVSGNHTGIANMTMSEVIIGTRLIGLFSDGMYPENRWGIYSFYAVHRWLWDAENGISVNGIIDDEPAVHSQGMVITLRVVRVSSLLWVDNAAAWDRGSSNPEQVSCKGMLWFVSVSVYLESLTTRAQWKFLRVIVDVKCERKNLLSILDKFSKWVRKERKILFCIASSTFSKRKQDCKVGGGRPLDKGGGEESGEVERARKRNFNVFIVMLLFTVIGIVQIVSHM